MDRVFAHVGQRVVHPAHVPFVTEAEPAIVDRCTDTGKGCAFLGNGDDAVHIRINKRVRAFQELDRFQIFAPAIRIGNPLAFLARIVAVKHGRNGIHAEPVDMVFTHPVDRIGNQKVLNLRAAVVVDERAPVRMPPFPRIGVLIKRCAVEPAETVLVFGKVTGDPVDDQAKSRAMARINEGTEFIKRSIPDRWCIKPDRLIPPGSVEWML